MSKYIRYLSLLSFVFFVMISMTCSATEVVRANFLLQGTTYPVDLALDDTDSPITVANFLKYADGGYYKNLIVNRSVSNFVIQTGGYTFDSSVGPFTYDSSTGTFNDGLQTVPTTPTTVCTTNPDCTGIQNESTVSMLSNVRGTIAMAQSGSNPDSATNQWFINLADNSFLDTSVTLYGTSPGFTVFGSVLGNGMNTIDSIAALSIFDLSSDISYNGEFTSVPLANYTSGTPSSSITDQNLAKISSMERLYSLPSLVKFAVATASTTQTKTITINNYSPDTQTITVNTSLLTGGPFAVSSSSCTSSPLGPGTPTSPTSCSMQVTFSPSTSGEYDISTLNIGISASTYSHTFPVTLRTPIPIINVSPTTINFGAQPLCSASSGGCSQTLVYVHDSYYGDTSESPLQTTNITFNTSTPNDFQFIDNCSPANANNGYNAGQVASGNYCVLVLNFTPTDYAVKSGTITINSDDPVNGTVTIPVTGGATTDSDGVSNSTEDAAPNGGDNNDDGIPDKLQSYVASFPAIQNIYTSLITDSSKSFASVAAVPLSTLPPLPNGVHLDDGAFSFKLSGFTAGSTVQFGLILPAGATPSNIYSYGPTSGNSTPHWYALSNNTSPGVVILGNSTLSNSSGSSSVSRNLTEIQIQDGGAGDSDMKADGVITFVGGAEVSNSTSSSGAINPLWLLLLSASVAALRKRVVSS